jgi:hypothetical protein
MASTERLELPTVRLEGACSIRLSYVDIVLKYNIKISHDVQGQHSTLSTVTFFPSTLTRA